MKNNRNIILGTVLVLLGILLGLKALNLIDFNIFFNGWWTMFIIIPCFINVFKDEDKTGSIIGLIIGVLLFLSCNHWFSLEYFWKLLIPAIFVIIGLSYLFKGNKKIGSVKKNNKQDHTAIFAGQKINFDNEEFTGCTANAIFGGITINLRNAIINDDVAIDLFAMFGSVDILVPDNVKVKVVSNSIFGGVDNKAKSLRADDNSKTIYVNANCIFGGSDVK